MDWMMLLFFGVVVGAAVAIITLLEQIIAELRGLRRDVQARFDALSER